MCRAREQHVSVHGSAEEPLPRPRGGAVRECIVEGLAAYFVSGCLWLLGTVLGVYALPAAVGRHSPLHDPPTGNTVIDRLTQWDGQWYLEIAERGYSYDPDRWSSPAFFPLYPLLARLVMTATGVAAPMALLAVAHAALAGALVLLAAYVRERFPAAPRSFRWHVLAAFGLFPTTFFARECYSESVFVLLSLLVFYGLRRKWPLAVIASIVGLATAARSVGVALCVPLAFDVWRREGFSWVLARKLALAMPLAVWGLAAYVGFLWLACGEPMAFVKTQSHWAFRPQESLGRQAVGLATLEPLWSVYQPSSPAWWGRFDDDPIGPLSLEASNPAFFVLAVGLVAAGWLKRWLNPAELLFAGTLLLMAYLLRAFPTCMAGQGRFVGAVFPIYLVLGNLLARLPLPLAEVAYGLLAGSLAAYSAMFAAGHFFL